MIFLHALVRIVLFSPLLLAAQSPVSSEKANFRVEVIAEGLQNPWGLVKLPDGRFLATERAGRLRVIENGRLLPEPVAGIPAVWAKGQGGLLDIQLHPDYDKNGWIYLAYSDPKGDLAMTKIVRGRLKGNDWVDQETIFEADDEHYSKRGVHFGCRIVFDGGGHLFFSIGDRGDKTEPGNNAQRLETPAGKILRLTDDGKVPADNPFVKQVGAHPAIWSYGNRNAQGLVLDPRSGLLWETEHGPRGGDELNIIRKGLNYGWPVVTFGINYSGTPISDRTEAPGMEPPVIHWTPSIAVAGLAVYHGDRFPAWQGNLFAAALAHQKLVRIELSADQRVVHQEILLERSGRIRDVRALDDGLLYLVYDEPGKIVRLVPSA